MITLLILSLLIKLQIKRSTIGVLLNTGVLVPFRSVVLGNLGYGCSKGGLRVSAAKS